MVIADNRKWTMRNPSKTGIVSKNKLISWLLDGNESSCGESSTKVRNENEILSETLPRLNDQHQTYTKENFEKITEEFHRKFDQFIRKSSLAQRKNELSNIEIENKLSHTFSPESSSLQFEMPSMNVLQNYDKLNKLVKSMNSLTKSDSSQISSSLHLVKHKIKNLSLDALLNNYDARIEENKDENSMRDKLAMSQNKCEYNIQKITVFQPENLEKYKRYSRAIRQHFSLKKNIAAQNKKKANKRKKFLLISTTRENDLGDVLDHGVSNKINNNIVPNRDEKEKVCPSPFDCSRSSQHRSKKKQIPHSGRSTSSCPSTAINLNIKICPSYNEEKITKIETSSSIPSVPIDSFRDNRYCTDGDKIRFVRDTTSENYGVQFLSRKDEHSINLDDAHRRSNRERESKPQLNKFLRNLMRRKHHRSHQRNYERVESLLKCRCTTQKNYEIPRTPIETGNFLKSFNGLNRFVHEFFATPCSSGSNIPKNADRIIVQKRSYHCPQINALKPQSFDRSVQYETCQVKSKTDSIVCECLKQISRKMSKMENYFDNREGIEEDEENYYGNDSCCCCCCHHHHHNFHRQQYCCCNTILRKLKNEEMSRSKSNYSCRCRSVEVKKSIRNFGTMMSSQNLINSRNVSTNTVDMTNKMTKSKFRKKRCCCCCQQPPLPPCCHHLFHCTCEYSGNLNEMKNSATQSLFPEIKITSSDENEFEKIYDFEKILTKFGTPSKNYYWNMPAINDHKERSQFPRGKLNSTMIEGSEEVAYFSGDTLRAICEENKETEQIENEKIAKKNEVTTITKSEDKSRNKSFITKDSKDREVVNKQPELEKKNDYRFLPKPFTTRTGLMSFIPASTNFRSTSYESNNEKSKKVLRVQNPKTVSTSRNRKEQKNIITSMETQTNFTEIKDESTSDHHFVNNNYLEKCLNNIISLQKNDELVVLNRIRSMIDLDRNFPSGDGNVLSRSKSKEDIIRKCTSFSK